MLAFEETVTENRHAFETRGLGDDIYPDIRQCEKLLFAQPPDSLIGVQLSPEHVNFEDRLHGSQGYKIGMALGGVTLNECSIYPPFGALLTTLARQAHVWEQTVTFLQDREPLLQSDMAMVRSQAIQSYLIRQSREEQARLPIIKEEIERQDLALIDQRYREWVTAQYAYTVTLLDTLAEKIMVEKPDIAFVAEEAVMLLAPDQDAVDPDGFVRVIEGDNKIIQLVGLHWQDGRRKKRLTWQEKVSWYMKAREHYARCKRTVEEGKVSTDGEPAWTGTFTAEANKPFAEGLFEVYPAHKELFVGVIEDVVGTAQFSGTINDNEVFFRKTYMPEATLVEDSFSPLEYRGVRQPSGEYRGRWILEGNRRINGEFVLHKTQADKT